MQFFRVSTSVPHSYHCDLDGKNKSWGNIMPRCWIKVCQLEAKWRVGVYTQMGFQFLQIKSNVLTEWNLASHWLHRIPHVLQMYYKYCTINGTTSCLVHCHWFSERVQNRHYKTLPQYCVVVLCDTVCTESKSIAQSTLLSCRGIEWTSLAHTIGQNISVFCAVNVRLRVTQTCITHLCKSCWMFHFKQTYEPHAR